MFIWVTLGLIAPGVILGSGKSNAHAEIQNAYVRMINNYFIHHFVIFAKQVARTIPNMNVANDSGMASRTLYKSNHSCGEYDHLILSHCNAEITESEYHFSCIKKLIYCQPRIPTAHNVPATIVNI
jgi:hypothetical protein